MGEAGASEQPSAGHAGADLPTTRWATTSNGTRSFRLLNAVGTVQETHKGHLLVTIGDETETFDPARHKDIDAEQLTNLRRFLRKAGYGPGEIPA